MKVLQVTSPRDSVVLEVPRPTPGPGQVLMRIEAVTTCPQWDLHLRHNEPMFVGHRFEYPYTQGQPGHEACGFIEEVGPGVADWGPGDRVCAWRDAGHHVPGCYAQFVVHEAANVIRVPDGPPAEALAPLELAMCVGTVFRMLREMGVAQGRCIGVTGLGPAGLVAVQMAKAEGAGAVLGFDPLPARRDLARSIGADECFDPNEDLGADLPVRPGAVRLETAVDCVGAKASVEFLMDRTADVVALFGVQRESYEFAPRHYTLRLCGYKGHSRESAGYAVALIEAGKLDLAPLVTHVLPLERYADGIDLLETRQAIKVCFKPWES
jgi:threonine dehydrogenase-like Zn-dependent dehydrogenase